MDDGRYLVEKANIRNFLDTFKLRMAEKGYSAVEIDNMAGRFFTDKIVLKYTNKEQDEMWDRLMDIAGSPGGIRYLIDNMDYMNQFEHRRFRGLKSVSMQKFIKEKAQ